MNVYQIRLKLYTLKDINCEDIQIKISHFIDSAMVDNKEFRELHDKNEYKYFTFDMLYPQEADKVYKNGKIYTLTIRTINEQLAHFFYEELQNRYTDDLKGLTTEIKIISKRHITTVYGLTPIVIKNDNGYWRTNLSIDDFENRLKANLVKKFKRFTKSDMNEDFELFTMIEFTNKMPVAVKYKNIKLLGDKITLHIADNAKAQDLIYMALGTGIGENNARGSGFLNYKWL